MTKARANLVAICIGARTMMKKFRMTRKRWYDSGGV
jgi:hypothetical protein